MRRGIIVGEVAVSTKSNRIASQVVEAIFGGYYVPQSPVSLVVHPVLFFI